MNKSDYIYDLAIPLTPELRTFLATRPQDEELGESLDRFRRKLQKEDCLDEKMEKSIRSIHISYQANLLDSGIPLLTIRDIHHHDDEIIREFVEEAEDVLYGATLDEDTTIDFLKKYSTTNNPYICVSIALTLIRYRHIGNAAYFVKKAINAAFNHTQDYWDNKEDIYALSQLLFTIVIELDRHGVLNQNAEEDINVYSSLLEMTYLLLSRAMFWPEDDGKVIIQGYDLPITYKHRISAAVKRATLVANFKEYFSDLVPSYSTPGTMAVSDYALAHDFSFADGQLGTKSEFKKDAKRLYSTFSESKVRPFSTAIYDGRKDSKELAHRFYKKSLRDLYILDEITKDKLLSIYQNVLNQKETSFNDKDDKNAIIELLEAHDIDCFYHFTEKENIANIKKYGGLFSQRQCMSLAIPMFTKGDMRKLREKDTAFDLEDYVRLSFCKYHPLIYYRQANGANLVLLKIKKEVAYFKDTLFSDRDAALDSHHHGDSSKDLQKVNFEAVKMIVKSHEHIFYDQNQAEIMVRGFIPIDYILNINHPEELQI